MSEGAANMDVLQLMGWSAAFTQVGYKRRTKEVSHGTTHDRH